MITIEKGKYFFNYNSLSNHPELQNKVPLYMTRKDAESEAKKIGWKKKDVVKVAVEKSLLFDYGWAIGNKVAGEIHIFSIGSCPIVFSWAEANSKKVASNA